MGVQQNKSRAPIVLLQNRDDAVEGELFIEETDSEIKLCFKKRNGHIVNLLRQGLIETAVMEALSVTQHKFSQTEPQSQYERLWLETEVVEDEQL